MELVKIFSFGVSAVLIGASCDQAEKVSGDEVQGETSGKVHEVAGAYRELAGQAQNGESDRSTNEVDRAPSTFDLVYASKVSVDVGKLSSSGGLEVQKTGVKQKIGGTLKRGTGTV